MIIWWKSVAGGRTRSAVRGSRAGGHGWNSRRAEDTPESTGQAHSCLKGKVRFWIMFQI